MTKRLVEVVTQNLNIFPVENKISNAVEEVVPEVTRQKETNVEAPIIENQSSVQGHSFCKQ